MSSENGKEKEIQPDDRLIVLIRITPELMEKLNKYTEIVGKEEFGGSGISRNLILNKLIDFALNYKMNLGPNAK